MTKSRSHLMRMMMRKILRLLIISLIFYGTACQPKKNDQERHGIVISDSIFTGKPSGILLTKSYTNEEDGYSINYPSNWNFFEYENAGGTDFFGHFDTPAGNDDMSDLGVAVYKNEYETLDEFYQNYLAELKSFELLSDISIEKNMSFIYQDKYKVNSFVFTAKSVGTFDTRVNMFIEKGDKIYHLRGLLSPKYPAKSLQLYYEIMTTIQFLK